ncbi:hypothetical protein [Dyadobacter psychrotolerans]|uniref:Uncharacterized protein n=1 Tax=Dyadobacter psychrotolerans TaxID=2541721 RepID=A0A4R5DEY5_9BACT|nr:hypothetical protein [Dyadobacter psychrotolerans]TDE11717.1 hypothetical protein E0F88_25160 [Dyadobacter psychrotolerans]
MYQRNKKDLQKSWFRSISFIILCLPFTLLSCDDAEHKKDDQVKSFYDVRGFVEGQIILMNNERPEVSKTVSMGDEKNQVSAKDVDWKKELELFLQADINKPAYRLSYTTQKPDSFTTIYAVKPGEQQLPVHYLKVIVDSINQAPTCISAVLKSENKLYQSEKNIELNCVVNNTGSRIVSYKITGYQKLATMDKNPFAVKAEVHY